MLVRTSRLIAASIQLLAVNCLMLSVPAFCPAAMAQDLSGTEAALESRVNGLSATVTRPDERDALKAYYQARAYRPVWFDAGGPTRAARDVVRALSEAPEWGLDVPGFDVGAYLKTLPASGWTPEQVATAEIETAADVLRYARQARGGRISEPDRMLSSYLDRRPVLEAPSAVLGMVTVAADQGAALRGFHPSHPQFAKLHALLKSLRREGARDPEANIASEGPLLSIGVKGEEITKLRRRLGLPANGGDDDVFDADVKVAVKAFQASASLRADGLVGQATRRALNKDNTGKINAVIATMEQWRWMPADLGDRHILVNVPAFAVDFVKDGLSQLHERVIVGKPETQTPIFSKRMSTVVLRPSWVLPDSIKVEKLLAAQRRGRHLENEGIIIKKGQRVVKSWTVDWAKADLSKYAIYQPSGDGNALGDVKFLFPNKHSVYLHDTPNKSLFNAGERLFSHGCVRLRNPLRMAQLVLDTDKGEGTYDVEDLAQHGPGSNEVTLDKSLPMHIGYFSVSVGEDGKAEFHGDPYGHDERITLALRRQWEQIDKGSDHLAPIATGSLKGVQFFASPLVVEQRSRQAAGRGSAPGGRGVPAAEKLKKAKYVAHEKGSVGALMNSAIMR